MIAEAGEVLGADSKGKLSTRGMLRLAKRWIRISNKKKELQMFMPLLEAKTRRAARAKWKQGADRVEVPMSLFYAFWQSIKERYTPESVWEKGEKFHLLYIITMHVMQDLFLDTKSTADVAYQDISAFKADVKKFFQDVPATFFVGWSATGLQTEEGSRNIREAIEDLRRGMSLKTLKQNSSLYRS
jgi:hypothetical protein